MYWNASRGAVEALEAFERQVCDFLSSSCEEAKSAAAMLILSLTACRHERQDPKLDAARLIRCAWVRSRPQMQERTEMDDLVHSCHLASRRSPAWELYMNYRDNPSPVRHHALTLLAGGFWPEFFLLSAEETVHILELEAAWDAPLLPNTL